MFSIVFEDGSAAKLENARKAAAETLISEHDHVMYESESERRAFLAAHDALVNQRVQNGVGLPVLRRSF